MTNMVTKAISSIHDWMQSGSETVQNIKGFGATALFAGLIGLMVVQKKAEEQSEIDAITSTLDNSPYVVMHSQQQCQSLGYSAQSCIDSQDNALSLKDKFDPVKPIVLLKDCTDIYGICSDKITTTTRYGVDLVQYAPEINAWQASKGDISIAAPLYPSANQNESIRIDGQRVTLN